MHRHRRLTPFLVLRALCLGDLAFFEIAMAVMAKVPVRNARILIHDAGPNGLASLYEKAGMPPRLLPAVRVAVDVVRGTEFDGGERDRERYRSRVITRILTQFEDLPQEDLDYLLDKLGDVLTSRHSCGDSGVWAESKQGSTQRTLRITRATEQTECASREAQSVLLGGPLWFSVSLCGPLRLLRTPCSTIQ